MDDIQPPQQRRFDDVARPENVPANPSSRPVIVGNKPEIADPMVAPEGSQNLAITPEKDQPNVSADDQQVSSVQSTSEVAKQPDVTSPSAVANASNQADTTNTNMVSAHPDHKIRHDEAFFGHMKPKKSLTRKLLIGILVLGLLVGIIFFLLN